MQVVILCGGRGIRLMPNTSEFPKPLIEVGEKPILWHIMKIYATYGYKDFILCLGYLGDKIREHFSKPENKEPDWNIEFVDTGEETQTGGRIKRIENLIKGDEFMATYGDGVADIDANQLLAFHKFHGGMATLTVVRPSTHFGILDVEPVKNRVLTFIEKPILDYWVNGGFFVFNRKIFDFINGDKDVLEREVFSRILEKQELYAYKHPGFWRCMDNLKDVNDLNDFWQKTKPWAVWKKIVA
jgi:glucose-1-phosphate cytidylyltransferase